VSVAVQKVNEESLRQAGASGGAKFLLAGQIGDETHGLYLIDPQANAIMATPETPYLQIGESKYGKPQQKPGPNEQLVNAFFVSDAVTVPRGAVGLGLSEVARAAGKRLA
jgi:predicted proteasome-type protease